MSVFELAQRYFPRLWNEQRILALQQAGKLTQEEVTLISGASAHKEN